MVHSSSARALPPPSIAAALQRAAVAKAAGHTAPQAVTVRGWVWSVRGHKRVAFLVVGDGSAPAGVQVVVDADVLRLDPRVTHGASVEVLLCCCCCCCVKHSRLSRVALTSQ